MQDVVATTRIPETTNNVEDIVSGGSGSTMLGSLRVGEPRMVANNTGMEPGAV